MLSASSTPGNPALHGLNFQQADRLRCMHNRWHAPYAELAILHKLVPYSQAQAAPDKAAQSSRLIPGPTLPVIPMQGSSLTIHRKSYTGQAVTLQSWCRQSWGR